MVYHWIYVLPHKKNGFSVKTKKTPRWNTWDLFMNSPLLGYSTQLFKTRMGLVVFTELLYMVIFFSPFLECACETAVWT